jgi:hypothetical protein
MARVEGTYIYRQGASPNTRVAISQKNRVFSKPFSVSNPALFRQVGVLSTFDYTESRAIDPVRGVGFGDRIQELVPGVTEPMGLTLNRTLLYTANIMQEIGYRAGVDGLVRSLRHHKWPFDIRSELVFSELVTNFDQSHFGQRVNGKGPIIIGSGEDQIRNNVALLTYFEACWLENVSISFPSDSAIVMEDAGAKATDVTDGLHSPGVDYTDIIDSGNDPITNPGSGSRLFGTDGVPALEITA